MNEAHNPWTVLNERIVYDNKWIGLTEYDVLNPGGGKGIYGKVRYKNLAIGVLPLDDEGNTWLVGQYRFVLNAYSWEIPEGGGDPALPPVESARRELLEETGLVAAEWLPLMTSGASDNSEPAACDQLVNSWVSESGTGKVSKSPFRTSWVPWAAAARLRRAADKPRMIRCWWVVILMSLSFELPLAI